MLHAWTRARPDSGETHCPSWDCSVSSVERRSSPLAHQSERRRTPSVRSDRSSSVPARHFGIGGSPLAERPKAGRGIRGGNPAESTRPTSSVSFPRLTPLRSGSRGGSTRLRSPSPPFSLADGPSLSTPAHPVTVRNARSMSRRTGLWPPPYAVGVEKFVRVHRRPSVCTTHAARNPGQTLNF